MGRCARRSLPQIRLHARSGHARVRINGTEYWLGKFGSPTAQAAYDRLIAEYLSNGRQLSPDRKPRKEASPPPPVQPQAPTNELVVVAVPAAEPADESLTVAEICVRFLHHAQTTYRLPSGRLSSSYHGLVQGVKALRPFARLPATAFGPRTLRQVTQMLVDSPTKSGKPRPRTSVNRIIKSIRHIFKWAASMEMIPASCWQGLQTVESLRKGRTTAPELPPVRAVADEVVEVTLPHLPEVVADLVRFIRHAGCRPGEACLIRPCDIEQTEDVWTWRLASHKNAWRDHDRVIMLGPKAQAVLLPYLARLATSPTEYCFSPIESERCRRFRQRQECTSPRRTARGSVTSPGAAKRPPRDHYDDNTLNRCIRRACEKAQVPRWTPMQLRHSVATEARMSGGGLDAAQIRLGHKHAKITEVYAELTRDKAAELARRLG